MNETRGTNVEEELIYFLLIYAFHALYYVTRILKYVRYFRFHLAFTPNVEQFIDINDGIKINTLKTSCLSYSTE